MAMREFPPEFIARCEAVTAKRPRTVINHILAHGYVTTESDTCDLRGQYVYTRTPGDEASRLQNSAR